MIRITGEISTASIDAGHIAAALAPDNLTGMTTGAEAGRVVTTIESGALRSVTASVDDYLMNLAIAEEICGLNMAEQTGEENPVIKSK
ncbi:KEOPS complex subunit Pcc1 [Methanofollis fontis]|uniref:Uncharacterized protein n=1 Tax=Methanofollis fontis TaxID=2052832 RepID=A0A483CND0_9EURY|nr:KEOPS complex subunit Pcc1 [Methanofollis fontis]TAJ43481.1 hypothetical protein CUJ86_10855 [Methanofollis fontis]